MEQYNKMTDEELIRTLKKYGMNPGPIVGTTRTLYEKKLYEVERTKTRYPPSSGSYEERQYDLPRKGIYERRTHEDVDDDHFEESYSMQTTKTFVEPSARQRGLRDDFQNREKHFAYQDVSQVRHSLGSAQAVEPRRPIREKIKDETPNKRSCPLWLHFLLIFLFVGFLAFVYFYVQETNDNPFRQIKN
ncbi:emerin isoform X2 [Bombina bombina]|uniref:emerin isoform X2 n=1 Tax=Bombina bombina TaxID=8345 RepID=UPI00235ADFCB|nr:emerin isoform X2 [Bombina bombina]